MVERQQNSNLITPYFTEFLPSKINQPLLPGLKNLSISFVIEIYDPTEFSWSLRISGGVLHSISTLPHGQEECWYRLDTQTFLPIVQGKLSPQRAFFKRRVEITGNLEKGLRLAFVLGDFFSTFPYSGKSL